MKTRFSSGLSLSQICENFIKAAYDPRYLVKVHYWLCTSLGEKEYYLGCAYEELYAPPSAYFSLYGLTAQAQFLGGVLEKVGVEPQVQRIGKYKSAGD
ncbi:putative peptidase S49 [Helianthus anomalus]